jgi:type I restriction enzyme, S subunit
MASDGWTSVRLGDVCTKVGSGATPRGGHSVYLDTGDCALIRSQNIYNDGFRSTGLAFITEEHAQQLANVAVEADDVLLNITGDSVARCCRVDPRILPARVNQHVAIIRPDQERLDARYLRYCLVSPSTTT